MTKQRPLKNYQFENIDLIAKSRTDADYTLSFQIAINNSKMQVELLTIILNT